MKTIKTIENIINFGADLLVEKAIVSDFRTAVFEVKLLLSFILGKDLSYLIVNKSDVIDNDKFILFNQLLNRRLLGEPVYKIIGKKPFYKYEFITGNSVLDPRSDTEVLIESVFKYFSKDSVLDILEFGVGSGCILLSVLNDLNNSFGIGIDISSDALDIANKNLEIFSLFDRCNFICSSWNDFVCDKKFDVIISNPPYIKSSYIDNLDIEVRKFDPIIALDGGADGLNCYREIADISGKFLKNNGHIFLEIGIDQENDVCSIFNDAGFKIVDMVKDLSGVIRVLHFIYI